MSDIRLLPESDAVLQWARDMVHASPAPMLVLRAGMRVGTRAGMLDAVLNPACAALLGVVALPDWTPVDDVAPLAASLPPAADAILSGRAPQLDVELAGPHREALGLALSPLRTPDGAIAGLLGVASVRPARVDETARELGRMVALSPVGVVRYSLDGTLIDCNDAFLDMLGLSRADRAAGLSWRALTPPEWHDVDAHAMLQLRTRGVMPLFEKEYLHRDGHRVPVLVGAGSLIANRAQGFAVIIDISATHAARRALAASEARFRAITNAMPQMVWSTLPDGFHDYYNDQWYAFTGVPHGSTDGAGWNGMFHPDDQDMAWGRWRHSLATGEQYEIEYRLRHHSGGYRWVLGRALPVRDETGAITRWMGTCTDIHEHKLTEDALRETDQRKDEFLAMLGHELRNPLAPIRSAASLLPMIKADPARVEQIAQVIARQTTHMTGLIDDLLDVSRVTRGMVTLERADVAPRQLVDEAVEQVRPLLESRAHQLSIVDAAPGATVHGDRKRLVQVLANLLSNAARYTPAGGRIAVHLGLVAGELQLAVRDNGIGMAPALVASAFELFRQGARTPDRSQGGLGIGLALVRSLVQLHGGQVRLSSAGEGLGSEALVTLPLSVQPAHAVAAAAAAPAGTLQTGALRVLVVDDNADSAELVAMYLRMMGHQVVTEFDAAAALARAAAWRPDACILDIGLPDMDGNALAQRLRDIPGMQDVRLAAMTGYSQPQDLERGAEAGFLAYFVKPVAMDQLAQWLAAAPPESWAG